MTKKIFQKKRGKKKKMTKIRMRYDGSDTENRIAKIEGKIEEREVEIEDTLAISLFEKGILTEKEERDKTKYDSTGKKEYSPRDFPWEAYDTETAYFRKLILQVETYSAREEKREKKEEEKRERERQERENDMRGREDRKTEKEERQRKEREKENIENREAMKKREEKDLQTEIENCKKAIEIAEKEGLEKQVKLWKRRLFRREKLLEFYLTNKKVESWGVYEESYNRVSIEDYSDLIPLPDLQMIEREKDNYDLLEIWEETEEDDPILIGGMTYHGERCNLYVQLGAW